MGSILAKPPHLQGVGQWRRQVRSLMGSEQARALEAANRAIAEHPDDPDLLAARGELLVLMGRDTDAEPDLRRALELAPTGGKSAIRLAWLFLRQGRTSQALAVMDSAVRAGGKRRLLRHQYGRLLIAVGEYQRAARQIARAIAMAPRANFMPLHEQALAGLADDAAQGVWPEQKSIHRIATERLCAGDAAGAEALLAKLTRSCPAYAPGWIAWRGALEAQGKTEEAKALRRVWTIFSPRSKALIEPAMSRPLSRRGLLFDPRGAVPIRPMDQILTRVKSPAELKNVDNGVLMLDEGGAPVELDPVISLDGTGADRISIRYQTGKTFVAALNNAAVVGRGIPITQGGETIEELTAHDPFKIDVRIQGDSMIFDAGVFKDGACSVKVFDTPALLLAGGTDASFGDWILNFPNRLALAEAAELDCPVILRADLPLPQNIDMLEALGVKSSRILLHDPYGVSVFPRLYLPSWPLRERKRPMAGLLDFYRRAALAPPPGPRERLYLSREGTVLRKLTNEAQIRELFEQRGFRVVHPERLSFAEVRRLFANPACVAGPYGSAFLNLAFGSQRPVGLVLAPPEPLGFVEEMALWMGSLGVKFGYLRGEREPDAGRRSVETASWTIRPDRVEAAIDQILAGAE